MLIATATLCLAVNVYQEARGEPIPGQYAVAFVTMQRAKQDRKKVCKAVFEPWQFSWTVKGARKEGIGWRVDTPKEKDAWKTAQIVADQVLAGRIPNWLGPMTHYHAREVKPRWRLAMTRIKTIGRHIFYRSNQSGVTS
jgi:spore germination cell wall hydrolase CwlJ-like protein